MPVKRKGRDYFGLLLGLALIVGWGYQLNSWGIMWQAATLIALAAGLLLIRRARLPELFLSVSHWDAPYFPPDIRFLGLGGYSLGFTIKITAVENRTPFRLQISQAPVSGSSITVIIDPGTMGQADLKLFDGIGGAFALTYQPATPDSPAPDLNDAYKPLAYLEREKNVYIPWILARFKGLEARLILEAELRAEGANSPLI